MITATAFRQDFPEFGDTGRFSNSQINLWLLFASILLNSDWFGEPAPFQEATEAINAGGLGYAVGDKLAIAGGTFTIPVMLQVDTVGNTGAITGAHVINQGAYTIVPTNPAAQLSTSGKGTGAAFNLTFVSGTYTAYDLATELFVAHNTAIERRAQDEATTGAIPGLSTGPISAKSVDKVSLSYDVASAIVAGMGDLNLTIYGTRLAKLINMFGMGPVTVVAYGAYRAFGWMNGGIGPSGIGQGVQPILGPAWAGPIYSMGIDWDN